MGPWLLVLGFSLQSTGPLPPWLSHVGGFRGGAQGILQPCWRSWESVVPVRDADCI